MNLPKRRGKERRKKCGRRTERIQGMKKDDGDRLGEENEKLERNLVGRKGEEEREDSKRRGTGQAEGKRKEGIEGCGIRRDKLGSEEREEKEQVGIGRDEMGKIGKGRKGGKGREK